MIWVEQADVGVLLESAAAALRALGDDLWRLDESGLSALLTQVDGVVRAGQAAQVVIATHAVTDGHVREKDLGEWVATHASSLRAAGASRVAKFVLESREMPGAPDRSGLGPVREAVSNGTLDVGEGRVVIAELRRMRPYLEPGAVEHVCTGLVGLAPQGIRTMRQLRPALYERYGITDLLTQRERTAVAHRSLSAAMSGGDAISEYRLLLDPEAAAMFEAAIGPLSAPQPVDGERDLRPSDQRRGDALVEIVRAAVGAGSTYRQAKTQLVLTMDLQRLLDGVGGGTCVGGLETGEILAAGTVRRLACQAELIPEVLGGDGDLLDLGRSVRCFDATQIRALWGRDEQCTYPACQAAAKWCDAHHLVHWLDGGPTALWNAALLCERHHTRVHARRLAGVVTEGGRVEWDLTPGSYDALMATMSSQGTTTRPGHHAGPPTVTHPPSPTEARRTEGSPTEAKNAPPGAEPGPRAPITGRSRHADAQVLMPTVRRLRLRSSVPGPPGALGWGSEPVARTSALPAQWRAARHPVALMQEHGPRRQERQAHGPDPHGHTPHGPERLPRGSRAQGGSQAQAGSRAQGRQASTCSPAAGRAPPSRAAAGLPARAP